MAASNPTSCHRYLLRSVSPEEAFQASMKLAATTYTPVQEQSYALSSRQVTN